jgi:uncharacterized protein
MEFEWDEAKDAANRAKHGLSLADAVRLDWGRAENTMDARRDYGEVRIIAFAPLAERLHTCVYTVRGATRRIISLRKSNLREIRDYEKARSHTYD